MSVAYWCVLAAALLPYFTVALAKARSRYDNRLPRSVRYEGIALRAHHAHQNGFESFPLFAAAVFVASGGSSLYHAPSLNLLALGFIASRLAYIVAFLLDRPSLRSLMWFAGLVVALVIFTMPVWHQ